MGYLRKLLGGDAVSCGPGNLGVISEGECDAFWPWELHKERALSWANGSGFARGRPGVCSGLGAPLWRNVVQGRELKVDR